MEKIKKTKKGVVLILLVIGLLTLIVCYIKINNSKIQNSKFITITNPYDRYYGYNINVLKLYDENFNVIETKSIKEGGYLDNFETDDKYYLLGTKNLLSIDKKTKKIKEVENNFLESTSYYVEEYNGNFIFLDQIITASDSDNEYKVHDVGNFKEDNIKTFKGTKPNIRTLIKVNEKYYAISSDKLIEIYGEISKKYIEVFDNECNFLYSKEIENPRSYYKFFKHYNNVYVIANDNPSNLFKFDLEKEEIVKEPIMRVEEGVFQSDGEDLYIAKRNKVMKINLDNLELEKVFDSTDYYGNTEEDTEIFFYTRNSSQLIILNKETEDHFMGPKELYIRSKGEKEFRKTVGKSIVDDLHSRIFIGDLN